eukprot:10443783-Ditylum_brightwellii.AAC.1
MVPGTPLDDSNRRKTKKKKKKAPSSAEMCHREEANPFANKNIKVLLSNILRLTISVVLVYSIFPYAKNFYDESHRIARGSSHPQIMSWSGGRLIDDYRDAYWWLRDNTPADSRIMAWWDYGYQIAAIANRTTLADGNTWNHEHIALLGMILTAPEKEAHRIAKHLADYVLIWAGGGGDDVAKHLHLARIANSVYRHVCPEDPTCSSYGFQ